MLVKGLKLMSPMCNIKVKLLPPPPLLQMTLQNQCPPRMHLKDDCSHVISEINPQGSNQPKATSGKSKGDNSDRIKIWKVILCFYD
jgi:hypothetical protein